MIETVEQWNGVVNGFVWGGPMIVLLIGTGLLLTILTRGVQFSRLAFALREVLGRLTERQHGEGKLTPFQAVATALASLPEEDRLVVTLYFLRDLSYRDVAAVVGLPVGTLRSRLHRARRRLQRRLWDLAVERGIPTALVEEQRP